jgi:parallel beta-helix repeat protein
LAPYSAHVPAIAAPLVVGQQVLVVHKGGSIQAVVDSAQPGAVIDIEAGHYAQAVTVATPGIQLIGLQDSQGHGVVIENPGNLANGITVTASGFILKNVTVKGFEENGVLLTGVLGFTLSHVTALDNGEYGLFPVFCSRGLIEYCLARGHADTGIYVGQSTDVVVSHSQAFDNVNGIEVENSSRVQVIANESGHNVVGILVVLLPGLQVTVSLNNQVIGNYVHDNNHVNFASPGDITALEPSGTGILVIGADHTTVENNVVTNNNFIGIGVASTTLLTQLAGITFTDIEPNPDGTQVENNVVTGNGQRPSPIPDIVPTGADLLWDGSGKNNCWSDNVFVTVFSPIPLPVCP